MMKFNITLKTIREIAAARKGRGKLVPLAITDGNNAVTAVVDVRKLLTWALLTGVKGLFEVTVGGHFTISTDTSILTFYTNGTREAGQGQPLRTVIDQGIATLEPAPEALQKATAKAKREQAALDRLYIELNKAMKELARATENLRRERDRYNLAQADVAATPIESAARYAKQVRAARRYYRQLQAMLEASTPDIFEKLSWLSSITATSDAFVRYQEAHRKWATYTPKKSRSRHASEEGRRRYDKMQKALRAVSSIVLRDYREYLGDPLTDHVMYSYKYSNDKLNSSRRIVRTWPQVEARLLREIEIAKNEVEFIRFKIEQTQMKKEEVAA